jgi:hypothetical protein
MTATTSASIPLPLLKNVVMASLECVEENLRALMRIEMIE